MGGLALPAPAVAQVPEDYHLTKRLTTNIRGNRAPYAATVNALTSVLGTVSIDAVLADANRYGSRVETAEGRNIAEQYAFGFHWDVSRDQLVRDWRPQGVSTTYDSLGAPVSTVMVSWYDLRRPRVNQGMRLSLVDWSSPRPEYRHVLMVEPYRTGGGFPTFAPIRRHAGGIAWYGNTLYVADTYAGLRVFDLTRILRVRDDRPNVIGLIENGNGDAGDYYGYDYKYVLPQIAAYDNTGLRFRYSAVSVDRTSSPHTMLASEYTASERARPKVLRLPLTGLGNAPNKLVGKDVRPITRRRGGRTVGQRSIQGAVSVNNTYYLSVSAGNARGRLYSWTPGAARPTPRSTLSVGPEDLSYDRTENVLWTCGEYESFRYVYAVDPTSTR
ncbi:hypothetical protein E0500_028145 [Streptomyces sp. KM273126]|uniref:hypothetical protein n=1 Tax=Streptomyces sp. KM273126 TaxID=2545247 RepID=UPI00104006CF|nr:hypothetical protein [Streptomyces sp. KM273126]MBA2811170.1 hypothetical protein [Streptomyces sp. KM273126]